jgi:hypothetical protein
MMCMSRRKMNVSITCNYSYFDRVDTDNGNKMFAIYALSRYKNRPHYYYCETTDLSLTELKLCKTVPAYKRLYYTPVDSVVNGINDFEKHIQPLRCKLPIVGCDEWSVFSLDNSEDISTILQIIESLYSVATRTL